MRFLLPLVLLSLAACARVPAPPPPPQGPPLTPDEIAARYVPGPSFLPPASSAPLGFAGTVAGRVPAWGGTQDTPLFRPRHTGPNRPTVGRIDVGGAFTADLPAAEPDVLPVMAFVLFSVGAQQTRCLMDTLTVEPPDARLGIFDAATNNTFAPAPGNNPAIAPNPYASVLPYEAGPGGTNTVTLVFVPDDVTVRGEKRCLPDTVPYRNIPTLQVNLGVNLQLAAGWNVVRRTTSRETVGQTLLQHVRFDAAPEEITRVGR